MFRKFFAALVALTLVVGGLFAEDIKGVFKKFEDGKVTIAVDGKEKAYKVNADAKVKFGKKEIPLVDVLKNEKLWKDGANGTFTVEKDEVTVAKRDKK